MSATTQKLRLASWPERGATAAVFLTLGMMVGAWAAALPSLALKLGLSTGQLSLVLFSLSVGAVSASIGAGFLLPRFASGRATGLAALAMVLAFALVPLASSLAQILVVGLALGATTGLLDVAVNGHAGNIEGRWGGPIMSSFHGAFSLGGLVGSSLGGLIIAAGFGLDAEVWIPVALALCCTVCALPFLGVGQIGQASGGAMTWPNRTLLGLCVAAGLIFVIEGAMADWSAVYLSSAAGSSLAEAAIGYAAFSITMAAGRLAGDVIVAKVGPRLVVGAGGGLTAVGLGLAVAFAQPWAAILGFALVGLGAANIVPAVFSAATRAGPSPSAGIALVTTVGYAGFLSGPPLIGAIAAGSTLRVALGCLIAAAALVAATGVLIFAERPRT